MNDTDIVEVLYKGTIYKVTNPGQLVYSKIKFVKGCSSFKRYEIVDQLNGCSELNYGGKGRVSYLKEKYGLTELEYYIIVVCLGDESKLPRCTYVNPYTGEKCNEPRKFYSLCPGIYKKTGNMRGIFHSGCKEHANNAAVQIAQRENYKKGVTGLQKADRKSLVWREKLSKSAKRQMETGNSIFSPDGIRNKGLNSYVNYITKKNNKAYDGKYEDLSIDNCIFLDKLMYLKRGNPDDTCYYYITYFNENPNIFKLGVTVDLVHRTTTKYHGYSYKNYEILFTANRLTVAEFEYKVKMKFKNYITLGTESFSLEFKDEIFNYINKLISHYNDKKNLDID